MTVFLVNEEVDDYIAVYKCADSLVAPKVSDYLQETRSDHDQFGYRQQVFETYTNVEDLIKAYNIEGVDINNVKEWLNNKSILQPTIQPGKRGWTAGKCKRFRAYIAD